VAGEAGSRAVEDLAAAGLEVVLADAGHSAIVAAEGPQLQSVRTDCIQNVTDETSYGFSAE
jgi:hypothetical protein